MNENLKKIIELSDNSWIQSKKPSNVEPIFDYSGLKHCGDYIFWVEDIINKIYVYLPVGFNPESGRLQITDLIAELIQTHPSKMVNFWDIHNRLIEIWGLIVK